MITLGNRKIREIYVGTNAVGSVYVGSSLVWQKGESEENPNLFDKSLYDLMAYLRYANLSFNTSTTATNLMARCKVEPSTSYKVEMHMDTRFRVFTYNGQPASGTVISGSVIDPLDDNGNNSVGEMRTLTITTGVADNMLYIGYWSSTGSLASEEVRNSIVITKNRRVMKHESRCFICGYHG